MKIKIMKVLLTMGLIAKAYNQVDLDSLVSGNPCGRCNLENAPLEGFSYAGGGGDGNLYQANLKGANLKDANLSGINAKGANFLGANLNGTNFDNTDLSGAIWTNGKICAEDSIGTCK